MSAVRESPTPSGHIAQFEWSLGTPHLSEWPGHLVPRVLLYAFTGCHTHTGHGSERTREDSGRACRCGAANAAGRGDGHGRRAHNRDRSAALRPRAVLLPTLELEERESAALLLDRGKGCGCAKRCQADRRWSDTRGRRKTDHRLLARVQTSSAAGSCATCSASGSDNSRAMRRCNGVVRDGVPGGGASARAKPTASATERMI
jgi:hypothetical protein